MRGDFVALPAIRGKRPLGGEMNKPSFFFLPILVGLMGLNGVAGKAGEPASYGGVTPVWTDETRKPDPLPSVPAEQASSQRPWHYAPKLWSEMLDYYTKNNIMPAVAILVSNPNWGTRFACSGKAVIEDPSVKLLPSTQFRIGSCSKIFVAVTMLQMDAEHKVNLGDRIAEYLPKRIIDLVPNGNLLTIRQCLDMTSGLYSYTNEEYLGEVTADNAMYDFTQEQILTITKNMGTLTTEEPGGKYDGEYPNYTYTNTGYLLCGLIAETLEKKPLEQVLKERIFDRIKITDSFLATDYRVTKRTAHGYTGFRNYGCWIDCTRYNQDVPWAAGAVISTPFDMIQFYEKLLTTEELIPVESRAKLLQMNYAFDHQGYGTGILEELLPTGPSYGHGGTALGYLTAVWYYPEEKTLYLQFSNDFQNKYTRAEVCYRMLDEVFGACDVPVPANGADAVAAEGGKLTLRWQAGDLYGSEHTVYIGTDFDQVMNATPEAHEGVTVGKAAGFSYEAEGLQPGVRYFWRVDAWRKRTNREVKAEQSLIDGNLAYETTYVNRPARKEQTITGPVWSFTTR